MEETKKKSKTIFDETIKCPYCKELVHIKKVRKEIEAGIPAEYEDKIIVEKEKQTQLQS